MQNTAIDIPTHDGWDDAAHDLAGLPDHLRPHAHALLLRFMEANKEWVLSREEIVSTITSASFRPILEQEARLSCLGLVS